MLSTICKFGLQGHLFQAGDLCVLLLWCGLKQTLQPCDRGLARLKQRPALQLDARDLGELARLLLHVGFLQLRCRRVRRLERLLGLGITGRHGLLGSLELFVKLHSPSFRTAVVLLSAKCALCTASSLPDAPHGVFQALLRLVRTRLLALQRAFVRHPRVWHLLGDALLGHARGRGGGAAGCMIRSCS